MTALLTREEYGAIADSLTPATMSFVDGGFRPAAGGASFATINPATGATLAEVAACGAADVDFAVAKAREAFDDGRWSKLHPSERKDVLIRLCKLMTRNAHELAVMESLDSGKTIYDCETVDVPETIHCLKWHAEAIDKIYDQVAPASDDHIAMVVREPIGVVGLVLPWNFPLLMLAWKIAPAIAMGNTVVVASGQPPELAEAGPVMAQSITPRESDCWTSPKGIEMPVAPSWPTKLAALWSPTRTRLPRREVRASSSSSTSSTGAERSTRLGGSLVE